VVPSSSDPDKEPAGAEIHSQRLVKAGPHGEVMTEERHQYMHWLAIYCTPIPHPSTEPAVRFLEAGHDLMHFMGLNEMLPERLDKTVQALGQTMPDFKPDSVINYTEVSLHYRPLISEVLITRGVDAFLTYVARLMALIFTSKPETLRSRSQVEIDYILSFESREEMVTALADDEVNRLARQGMRELAGNLQKRMGLVLFPDAARLDYAVELIEARNLIVHNGGIINRTYQRRVLNSKQRLGDKLHLFEAVDGPVSLAYAVIDIDERARAKFDLPVFEGTPSDRMCYRLGGV